MELPPVAIMLLTYERTEYALHTINSLSKRLKYAGELFWYVADDGSTLRHYEAVVKTIEANGGTIIDSHTGKNRGYGGNANKAWQALADKYIDITLWLEDDWVLMRDFDITPYAVMLHKNHREIGMVRTAYIPLETHMQSKYIDNRYYFKLMKKNLYTYSGNPHIKHTSFANSYGWMPEGRNPGRTEITWDHIVREHEGVDILIPPEIYDPPFMHIGAEKSYEGDA